MARFFLEFFRGDADCGFVFGGLLYTLQFIAAILYRLPSFVVRTATCVRRARVGVSIAGAAVM